MKLIFIDDIDGDTALTITNYRSKGDDLVKLTGVSAQNRVVKFLRFVHCFVALIRVLE